MENFKLHKTALLVASSLFLFVGCDTNDEIIPNDPDADVDAVLEVTEGGGTPEEEVTVDANTQSTVLARVEFISSDTEMRRLYITQNISGQGEEPYMPTENVDDKGDGSIDISSSGGNEFEFEFSLPVPSGVSDGTVEYKFWATSGKGDFRDVSQRLVAGPGTIILEYGSGSNPEAEVRTYENLVLEAPLEDGSSETFISLLDGEVYTIDQGNEFAAYWDFGYFYGGTSNASLASANNYPSDVIDVESIASTTEELNHAYFDISGVTSTEFDEVALSSDLDFIEQPASERITQLEAGDIVAFVDQYGKKGLIRVDQVEGTFGSDDFIQIDIKVQP